MSSGRNVREDERHTVPLEVQDLQDKIELYLKFPGSLQARLKDRAAGADEVELGAFVQDIAEDRLYTVDGELRATDGATYTIVWHPAPRSRWVEWDEVCHERRSGRPYDVLVMDPQRRDPGMDDRLAKCFEELDEL